MKKRGQYTQRTNKRFLFTLQKVLFVVAFILVGGGTMMHLVFADNSSSGPDPDWFDTSNVSGDAIRYVLENDVNVNSAGTLAIPVYVLNGDPSNTPSITVTANNLSGGYSSESPACLSGVAISNCKGKGICTIGCTVAVTDFTYDNTIGGWKGTVGASLKNGYSSSHNILQFQLSASNSAIIGYSSASGPAFAVAHTYTTKKYYNYSIPFGTACSQQSSKPVSVIIYDGDVGNNNIQPLPFQLEVVDTTTGTVLVNDTYTTVKSANDAGLGNNGVATYGFTADPSNKYVFEINHVYSHNTLQFELPYDSIYSQVTCSYALTPSISVTPDTAEPGTPVSVTPAVSNSGTVSSSGTQWQINTMVYTEGVTPAGVTNNTTDPCAYFATQGALACNNVAEGVGAFSAASPSAYTASSGSTWGSQNAILSDLYPAGSKVCYVLSVQPRATGDASWADSAPDCVTLGKKPKVDIMGGDLFAGRTFGSNISTGSVNTSISIKATVPVIKQESGVITGLYGTGVDSNGDPLTYSSTGSNTKAIADPHWSITNITPASQGLNPCQGTSGSAWTYNKAATVVDLDYDDTHYNPDIQGPGSLNSTDPVWKNRTVSSDGANGDWIGNNIAASNSYYQQVNNASCTFPAPYFASGPYPAPYKPTNNATSQAASAGLAPTWTFQTNFTVADPDSSCTTDPNSIQLTMDILADDNATIYLNGKVIGITTSDGKTSLPDNANYNYGWSKTPVTFTTDLTPGAFKMGANTLQIKVRSFSTSTGLLVLGNASSAASCTTTNRTTYGSWVEYGIMAKGTIQGMGSGAAFSGPDVLSTSVCNYSTLSFTNAGSTDCPENALNGGTIGGYSTAEAIPDVGSGFGSGTSLGASPTVNISSLPNSHSNYVYNATGSVTLTAATIPVGQWFVLNAPSATVTIQGNINYTTDTLHSISDIPQVVIIAKDIIIDDSGANKVTNVDAWLEASDSLNTCDTTGATTNITIATCPDVLQVNGPVMAGKLYLNRTGGAGPGDATGDPAEIFNLRPDAYLWGYEQSLLEGRLQSVYTTELPPRF